VRAIAAPDRGFNAALSRGNGIFLDTGARCDKAPRLLVSVVRSVVLSLLLTDLPRGCSLTDLFVYPKSIESVV
jgi:hypothetical protein